jgi:hypothetical protein
MLDGQTIQGFGLMMFEQFLIACLGVALLAPGISNKVQQKNYHPLICVYQPFRSLI